MNFQLSMKPVGIVLAKSSRNEDNTHVAQHKDSRDPANIAPFRLIKETLLGQFQTLHEQRLWKEYAGKQHPEQHSDLRVKIWEIYQGEVARKASAYYRYKMPRYSLADIDDISQAAHYGALRAIDAYIIEREKPFMAFANSRINGAIIDMLRQLQDFPRVVAKWRRQLRPIISAIRNKLSHEPTIDDICRHAGEDFRHILEDPLFASGVFNQNEEENKHSEDDDYLDDTQLGAKGAIEKRDHVNDSILHSVEAMDKILSVLPPTHTFIIFAYYFIKPGKTNAAIARNIGCSNSTVVNRHNEAIKMLRNAFTREEFLEIIR